MPEAFHAEDEGSAVRGRFSSQEIESKIRQRLTFLALSIGSTQCILPALMAPWPYGGIPEETVQPRAILEQVAWWGKELEFLQKIKLS